MKTTFITGSVSRKAGGVFDGVRGLVRSLHTGGGLDVRVLGIKDEHTGEDIASWCPILPLVFPARRPRSFGYSPDMVRALSDLDPDLLHTHGLWMYPSLAGAGWSRRTRKPHMVSPHGMLDPWALRNSRWKKRLAGWLYENTHLRSAACLHALCTSEAESIRRYELQNPICVVPNGVDLPKGDPTGAPPWGGRIEPGRKVLLYVGRLHPKKGLPNLLEAWEAVRSSRSSGWSEWSVVIIGWDQGGHARELEETIRSSGLGESVHLLGPMFGEAKRAAYAGADAFVLPSFSEGLPMTVLEAWSHVLPVVMTPECNLPEGFAAGAAVRVDATAESTTRGLSELLSMTDTERRTMGARGRKLVEERFTWPRIAAQMKAVYEWILGGGQRPPCVVTDRRA